MKSASSKRPKQQATPNAASEFRLKRDIGRRLAARFALRFHVVLIVLWSLTWGVACSKTLHWAGLDSRPWRYAVATVCAWLAMLVAIKLWLLYTGFTQRRKAQRASAGSDGGGDGVGLDFDFGLPRIGGNASRAATHIGDHGGTFSGAGASADFEPFASAGDTSLLGDAGSVADGLSSADEALPIVLVIAVVAAAAAACLGVLTYFYTQGPMLLSEAAFEVLLAGGLLRSMRRADDGDWLRTIVVKTAVPWLIVLGCAIGVGLVLR